MVKFEMKSETEDVRRRRKERGEKSNMASSLLSSLLFLVSFLSLWSLSSLSFLLSPAFPSIISPSVCLVCWSGEGNAAKERARPSLNKRKLRHTNDEKYPLQYSLQIDLTTLSQPPVFISLLTLNLL